MAEAEISETNPMLSDVILIVTKIMDNKLEGSKYLE